MKKIQIRLVTLLIFMNTFYINGQSIPTKCYENQNDYSYMWWLNTVKKDNMVFAVKTNKFVLSFDYANLTVKSLNINLTPQNAEKVLRESNSQSIPLEIPCALKFGLTTNDILVNPCKVTSYKYDDCQLIESGKYFHRRFINNLTQLTNCDLYSSGFEISTWSDRFSFILRAIPTADLNLRGLEVDFTFPTTYNNIVSTYASNGIYALKSTDGSGFIVMKSELTSSITITGTTVKAVLSSATMKSRTEYKTGMIIYPVTANIDDKLIEINARETNPLLLTVTAKQILPSATNLNVKYIKDYGWHKIELLNSNVGTVPTNNSRMERVNLVVTNTSSLDQILRLYFAKDFIPFATTGISAIIRDENGYPVGIPIQITKNWRTVDKQGITTQFFKGQWYHGITKLTIPANSIVNFEYTSVNALWGGVPAASHATLCLVGWGFCQQWDQAAIGAWGESITYEPDLGQAGSPILDFRPLMITDTANTKWGWTGNMGGADVFNETKNDGTRNWHSRIRTQYSRNCPNLTDVKFAGTMDDNSKDFEYSVSVGRSDDITRGIFKIKMKVLKNSSFKDFVIFQAATPTYHYTRSAVLAVGNENGLINQWNANLGTSNNYITTKKVLTGNVPWFSFTESSILGTKNQFRPANRGMVIRNWKARINGVDNVPPYYAEYNSNYGTGISGLINITPPPKCTSFQIGDYIEATIELFIVPKYKSDYYGPNQNLINALDTKANTWQMVYREAIGNDIDVTVNSGAKLLQNYPIKIESINDNVSFSVKGGIGYVPVTFTNVSTYMNPKLYQKINGSWVQVNQQKIGNDYWQTDYNAETAKFEITYNINLDSTNDEKKQFDFLFGDTTTLTLPTTMDEANVHIYPNPVSGKQFTLSIDGLTSDCNTKIQLVDLSGKKICEKVFTTNKVNFNLDLELDKGIYFVTINNCKSCFSKKLIVK